MRLQFTLRRILALIAVVILLSFVYFMVRAGYSVSLDYLENPARLKERTPAAIEPRELKAGWLVAEDESDGLSVSLRASVSLALNTLGYEPEFTSSPGYEQIAASKEGVVVTAAKLGELPNLEWLMDYARNGGLLVFAVRPEVDDAFRSIYQQLGIYEHGYFTDGAGIRLAAGLLTEAEYVAEDAWISNSAIELHVGESCRVYAANAGGVPLIWSLKYGRGDILVMNNSLMTYKSTGGLFISLLAQLKGPLLYPVVNARSVALEAFPLPSDVNRNYIRRMYLRSGRAFLRDVWWSDMVRFSRTSGIPLTAGFMTGYDSEAPLTSDSVVNEGMDLVFYAKELNKYGGEIGFTGFNQKPLYFGALSKEMTFSPWSDAELAFLRNSQAMELFSFYLPHYTVHTYLPPERLLDETGYGLIRQLLPDLQTICGDFNDPRLWRQDFAVDENAIAGYPVVSSGFEVGHEDAWDTLNVANALGVVFHSADASDILLETDPARSWNIISESFFEYAGDILSETGHLDGLTVSRAAWRLRDMLGLKPDITCEEDGVAVHIEGDAMPVLASFMLHCPGKEPRLPAGDAVKSKRISDGRYLVTSTVADFTLELVDS